MWQSIDQNHLNAIIDLSQRCHAVDGGFGFLFEPDAVRSRYLPDQPSSGIGAFASDGSLLACASVSITGDPGRQRARIAGQVRPDVRRKGMGTYLIKWSLEQARALLANVAEPQGVIEVATESLTQPAHHLYLEFGFGCVFEERVMERDLHMPPPDRPMPTDITVTTWQPDLAEQFFQAYHASFRDRPGFPGLSAAEWIAHVIEDDHRPDWSLLARLNGEPVGFVTGFIDLTQDPPGGLIGQIGVIPALRRRGLASALQVETMQRMQAAGAGSVFLAVNVNNPGAIKAYAQLGFIKTGRRARYERRMET